MMEQDSDLLPWLRLENDLATELTIYSEPYYVPMHPYMECSDGAPRNFGCRANSDEGCYWCYEGNKSVPFAFCVVENAGEFFIWQITRSIMKRLPDISPGRTVVVMKVEHNPWIRVLGSHFYLDIEPLDDELESIPERIGRGLCSVGYLLSNGPDDVYEFLNSSRER